jgi:hypothetical protein
MHQPINTSVNLGGWQDRHDRLRDLSKTLLVKNGKLVHRRLPVVSRPAPIGSDVAQCQPDQLGGRLVIGEMPPRLENLAQAGVHALNGIGGVNHPAHLGREGKERNHLVPDPAPGGGHSGEFLAPRAALKRIEFCQGGLGTGGRYRSA